MKQVLLYLPVLHAGHEAFFARHADAAQVLLLGCQFVIHHERMLAPGLTHVRGATPRMAPDRRPGAGR